jgi:hypothetical protein
MCVVRIAVRVQQTLKDGKAWIKPSVSVEWTNGSSDQLEIPRLYSTSNTVDTLVALVPNPLIYVLMSQGHKHTHSVTQNHKAQLANAYNELGKELTSSKIRVVGNYTLGKVIGEGKYNTHSES